MAPVLTPREACRAGSPPFGGAWAPDVAVTGQTWRPAATSVHDDHVTWSSCTGRGRGQPPATAGMIEIDVPSGVAVARPSAKRTSSSLT